MINEEIANIVYDYIKRGIGCDYDIFNSPPPPIPIRPVKIKTLKERLEEKKMEPTSRWKIEGIDKIWITQDGDEISILVKNKDDLTKIILVGEAIKNHNDNFITTLKADLEENEKENEELKKKNEALVMENEKNIKRFDCLNRKFNRVMNENLLKTPITDAMLVDDYNRLVKENEELKKEISKHKNTAKEGDYIMYNGSPYTPSDIERLLTGIRQLEELKTPTIENFTDEEPSSRRDILRCAEKCVCGKREQDYGTPESNFQLIADLWNDYLKKERSSIVVDAMDVSMMMALMKIARIRNGGGSGDSFVDLAGYAACGGEIWHSNKETNGDSSQETN